MSSRVSMLIVFLCASQFVEAQTLTFSRTEYSSSAGARAIAAADFDRNGWADLAHANFGRNTVTVLLNRVAGDAGLTARIEQPVGAGPFDMAVSDFNLDGVADLVVANADGNTLSILIGRGDGSFARSDVAAPGSPRAVASGDINRDGRPDLVYSAFTANRVQILLGDGRGAFSAGSALSGHAPRPQGVALGDFNKDGTLDLAVAYASAEGGLAILSLDREGRPHPAGVDGPSNLNLAAAGDFNQDGWLDVAAASTAGHALEVFSGGPSGMRHTATYSTGASPRGLTTGDVNHDGRLDVAAANRDADTISLFVNEGGAFDRIDVRSGPGSRAVVAADFNWDGRQDLATGNQDAPSASVLYNGTSFAPAAYALARETIPFHDNYSSSRVMTADVNHNGVPDVISDSYVLLDRTTLRALEGTTIHDVADLNGDGHLDLIASAANEPARVWENDGRGEFEPGGYLPVPASRQSLDVADMNADGAPDLVVSTYSRETRTGTLEILLRQADGGWASASRTAVPSWTLSVKFADLNLDGRLDVLTTYYQPALMDVFFGDGAGALAAPRSHALADYGTGVAIGDVDHDGAPDVVVGSWSALYVFEGSRTGQLTHTSTIETNGFAPKLADFNVDGHLDIVTGWTSILPGTGDGAFSAPEHFDTGSFYSTVADMNADGLPDLVSDGLIVYNQRSAENRPPSVRLPADFAIDYHAQFADEEIAIDPEAADPDLHALGYEWRDAEGDLVADTPSLLLRFAPGTHTFTLTVRDNRGGVASDSITVVVRPAPEIVIRYYAWTGWYYPEGTWEVIADPTAADGYRAHDPNLGAPKAPAPRANPVSYLSVRFIADPTQTYKLWLRGKADGNHWANDSVWLQFSGATNASGTPVFRTGTTSGLAVNLEECSGCGLSGWGWRDERWGTALNAAPVLLRFPEGGYQQIVIQTREDGLSIDQIVLSAERFRESAPGPPRNDSTIVPGFSQVR